MDDTPEERSTRWAKLSESKQHEITVPCGDAIVVELDMSNGDLRVKIEAPRGVKVLTRQKGAA